MVEARYVVYLERRDSAGNWFRMGQYPFDVWVSYSDALNYFQRWIPPIAQGLLTPGSGWRLVKTIAFRI